MNAGRLAILGEITHVKKLIKFGIPQRLKVLLIAECYLYFSKLKFVLFFKQSFSS